MKLVAPPLYVLTTQTLDKNKGVEVLTAGERWGRAGQDGVTTGLYGRIGSEG